MIHEKRKTFVLKIKATDSASNTSVHVNCLFHSGQVYTQQINLLKMAHGNITLIVNRKKENEILEGTAALNCIPKIGDVVELITIAVPAVVEAPINTGTKRRRSIETNPVARKRYTEAEVFKDNGINNFPFRKRRRKEVGIVPVEFGCTKRNHHIVYGLLHLLQYSNES